MNLIKPIIDYLIPLVTYHVGQPIQKPTVYLRMTPLCNLRCIICDEWNYDVHSERHKRENITMFKDNNDFLEYPCPYPYFYMMIRHNGDISICCFDYDSKTILENVKEDSLKSLWEGAAIIKIRKLMEQGDRIKIKACSRCSQYPNWWANFN